MTTNISRLTSFWPPGASLTVLWGGSWRTLIGSVLDFCLCQHQWLWAGKWGAVIGWGQVTCSTQCSGEEGVEGDIQSRQVTQLPLAFSWQRLCVVLNPKPASGIGANVPHYTAGREECRKPDLPITIDPVCVCWCQSSAPDLQMYEPWSETKSFRDLCTSNIYTFSERNSCQTTLLPKDVSSLCARYPSVHSRTRRWKEANILMLSEVMFLCLLALWFIPWTLFFSLRLGSKISTDLWIEKVECIYTESKGVI